MGEGRARAWSGRALAWAWVAVLCASVVGGCQNRGDSGGAGAGGACKSNGDCNNQLLCCNGSCVLDEKNCTQCGHACPAGATCMPGGSEGVESSGCRCSGVGSCESPDLCCGTACVHPYDPQNCGACGNTCPNGSQCLADASGAFQCVSNVQNCGGPGNACPAGQDCCNGKCASNDTDCGHCGDSCTGSTHCCTDSTSLLTVCIDTDTSQNNCGGCGIQCAANETCAAGVCVKCATGVCLPPADGGGDAAPESGADAGPEAGGDAEAGACLTIGTSCAAGDACCSNATCGAIDGQPGTACCLPRRSACGVGGCCGVTAGSAIPGGGYCTNGACCQYAHAVCGADSDCCAGTPGGKCSFNYYGVTPPFGACCLGSQDTCSTNGDCCNGDCNGGTCCEISTCRPGGNDCCSPGVCQNTGTCCLPAGSGCTGFIGAMGCCPGSGCNVTTGKCQ